VDALALILGTFDYEKPKRCLFLDFPKETYKFLKLINGNLQEQSRKINRDSKSNGEWNWIINTSSFLQVWVLVYVRFRANKTINLIELYYVFDYKMEK